MKFLISSFAKECKIFANCRDFIFQLQINVEIKINANLKLLKNFL